MMIEVSNGEVLDKLSIIEIKNDRGLNVDRELKILSDNSKILLEKSVIVRFFRILKAINTELWEIEDMKRDFERTRNFEEEFKEYSRAVYMLNDERAKIKKYIDNLTGSEISEQKSHEAYDKIR